MKKYIVLLLLMSGSAGAVQSIQWDRTVIKLELIVGVEQLVHFEGPGTVGLSPALADMNLFRNLFTSNTAYWKALQPFQSQRIKVKQGDDTVLFDVSAKSVKQPPKTVEPLQVTMGNPVQGDEPTQERKPEVTMFDLLRYAAQTDNAPSRVVTSVAGIHQVESGLTAELRTLYHHPDNKRMRLHVNYAWRAAGLYVTGLTVHNMRGQAMWIDPSKLQHTATGTVNGVNNRFIASAVVKRTVPPGGHTQIYVITDKPFEQIINLGDSS